MVKLKLLFILFCGLNLLITCFIITDMMNYYQFIDVYVTSNGKSTVQFCTTDKYEIDILTTHFNYDMVYNLDYDISSGLDKKNESEMAAVVIRLHNNSSESIKLPDFWDFEYQVLENW